MTSMNNDTEALMKEAISALRLANERIAGLERENSALRKAAGVSDEIGIVKGSRVSVLGREVGAEPFVPFKSEQSKRDVAKARAGR